MQVKSADLKSAVFLYIMYEIMEDAPKTESASVLENQKVKDFIESREIRPEDFHLIEKMASFPKSVITLGLHNVFNTYHEESGRRLEAFAENAGTSEQKSLYDTALEFYSKYDWAVSWNLVRILEGLQI